MLTESEKYYIKKKFDKLYAKICKLREDLPQDVLDALNGADNPSGTNVFVTVNDLLSVGIGTNIFVVPNYSSLPPAAGHSGEFYWCENSQGTAWLPGTLGGTYRPKGLYYSNGIDWVTVDSPYQATQSQVNAGLNDNQFVTPLTLKNSSQWATKNNSIQFREEGTALGTSGTVDEIDFVGAATASRVGNKVTVTIPTIQGVQGTQGIKGSDGVIGVDGAQGIQGLQGIQGIQGLKGSDGTIGVDGAQGIQGPQGTRGIQGFFGTQGTQGIQGLQGAQGTQGVQGETGIQGAQGLQGNQGTQGLQGIQGPQGTTGSQGAVGFTGVQGAQGTQGIQGLQGLQGFRSNVTVSDTAPISPLPGDLWFDCTLGKTFIWYDDGTSSQWVEHGSNGPMGTQGIQGTDGAYAAQGIQGLQGIQGALGACVWGSITGNLSDQTDLQLALNAKQDAYIYRHEYGTYDYLGKAVFGSNETDNVWTITRLTIASDGSTIKQTAVNVKWTERLTVTYT